MQSLNSIQSHMPSLHNALVQLHLDLLYRLLPFDAETVGVKFLIIHLLINQLSHSFIRIGIDSFIKIVMHLFYKMVSHCSLR